MSNLLPAFVALTTTFALAIGWYSSSHPLAPSAAQVVMSPRDTPSYQAPFGNPDIDPIHIIPGYHVIYLAPGHTIKDVSHVIGIDIEPHVDCVLRLGSDSVFSFRVKGIDDSLFAAIRSDPGVTMVDYDTRVYLID